MILILYLVTLGLNWINTTGQTQWIGIIGLVVYLLIFWFKRSKIKSNFKDVINEWRLIREKKYFKILDKEKKIYIMKRKEFAKKLFEFFNYVFLPLYVIIVLLVGHLLNGLIAGVLVLIMSILILCVWWIAGITRAPIILYISLPIVSAFLYFGMLSQFLDGQILIVQALSFLAVSGIVNLIFVLLTPIHILRKISTLTIFVTFSISLITLVGNPLISQFVSSAIPDFQEFRDEVSITPEDSVEKVIEDLAFIRVWIESSELGENDKLVVYSLLDGIEYFLLNNFDDINFMFSSLIERELRIMELIWNDYIRSELNQVQSLTSLFISATALAYSTGALMVGVKNTSKKSKSSKIFRNILTTETPTYEQIIECAFFGGLEYENLLLTNEQFKNIILENERNLEIPNITLKKAVMDKIKKNSSVQAVSKIFTIILQHNAIDDDNGNNT